MHPLLIRWILDTPQAPRQNKTQTEEMNLFGVEPLLSYTTVSVCNILDTEYFYMIAQTSYGEMMMRVYGKDPTSFSIALSEPRLRNWIKVASSEKQSAVSVYTKHSLPGEQPSPGGMCCLCYVFRSLKSVNITLINRYFYSISSTTTRAYQ